MKKNVMAILLLCVSAHLHAADRYVDVGGEGDKTVAALRTVMGGPVIGKQASGYQLMAVMYLTATINEIEAANKNPENRIYRSYCPTGWAIELNDALWREIYNQMNNHPEWANRGAAGAIHQLFVTKYPCKPETGKPQKKSDPGKSKPEEPAPRKIITL